MTPFEYEQHTPVLPREDYPVRDALVCLLEPTGLEWLCFFSHIAGRGEDWDFTDLDHTEALLRLAHESGLHPAQFVAECDRLILQQEMGVN